MQKAILVGPCSENKKRQISYNNDTLVIFIDGGLKHRKTKFNKSNNWLSIGDQDSVKTKPQIKLKRNKNESDLYHALKLLPKNISLVETYGLFPVLKNEKRFDHRLFNLGELFHHCLKSKLMYLLNDEQIILPKGEHRLDLKGEFSIICFKPTKLKLTGKAKYPLNQFTKIDTLSSRTLSNKGSGDITLICDQPVLLFTV